MQYNFWLKISRLWTQFFTFACPISGCSLTVLLTCPWCVLLRNNTLGVLCSEKNTLDVLSSEKYPWCACYREIPLMCFVKKIPLLTDNATDPAWCALMCFVQKKTPLMCFLKKNTLDVLCKEKYVVDCLLRLGWLFQQKVWTYWAGHRVCFNQPWVVSVWWPQNPGLATLLTVWSHPPFAPHLQW